MPKAPKIIPRGKWLLVKPADEASRENENGLIVPAKVEQERKAQGTVEALGKDVPDIKVGDRVVYGVFAGETISTREGGREVERKLLLEEDIIAFIKE